MFEYIETRLEASVGYQQCNSGPSFLVYWTKSQWSFERRFENISFLLSKNELEAAEMMRKNRQTFAEFVRKTLKGYQYKDTYFPKLV